MDEILIAFQCMQKILMYNQYSIDSYNLTSIQFYNLPSLLKTANQKVLSNVSIGSQLVTKVYPMCYQDHKIELLHG